jgi:hypothetical protein
MDMRFLIMVAPKIYKMEPTYLTVFNVTWLSCYWLTAFITPTCLLSKAVPTIKTTKRLYIYINACILHSMGCLVKLLKFTFLKTKEKKLKGYYSKIYGVFKLKV